MIEGRLCVRWADRPADLPQLEFLFHRCFPEQRWSEEDFRRFRRHQGRNNVLKVLAGEEGEDDEDAVYGAILYTVSPDLVRVRRVAVGEDHRRRGYGKFMLDILLRSVRRRFYEAVVGEANTAAQCLFRSAGFKVPRIDGIVYPTRQAEREGAKPKYRFTFMKEAPVAVSV